MLLAPLLLAVLQDPPARPVPPKLAGDVAQPAAPLLASDGQPLAPGRIPTDTAPEARAAWEQVLKATIGPHAARAPITAFDLTIDARVSTPEGGTNQVAGRYKFQVPGSVLCTIERNKTLLRGPEGDFLIAEDLPRGFERLERSRENEQDLKLLDDLLTISRNFIALSDPRQIRLASLKRAARPAIVPTGRKLDFEARAGQLAWLEVQSPDFRLTSGSAAQLYRIELGYDAQSFLPQLVLIHETPSGLGPKSVFIELKTWTARGAFQVPGSVRLFELDPPSAPAAGEVAPGATPPAPRLRFRSEAASDIFISDALINPPFTDQAFRPAAKAKSD